MSDDIDTKEYEALRKSLEDTRAELQACKDACNDGWALFHQVAECLGIAHEPHQTFNERVIAEARWVERILQAEARLHRKYYERAARLENELSETRKELTDAEQRAERAENENADLALRLQQSQGELNAKRRAWEESDQQRRSLRQKLQETEAERNKLQDAIAEIIDAYAAELVCECEPGDSVTPPGNCPIHEAISTFPVDLADSLNNALKAGEKDRFSLIQQRDTARQEAAKLREILRDVHPEIVSLINGLEHSHKAPDGHVHDKGVAEELAELRKHDERIDAALHLSDKAASDPEKFDRDHPCLNCGRPVHEHVEANAKGLVCPTSQTYATYTPTNATCAHCGVELNPNGWAMNAGSHDIDCPMQAADPPPADRPENLPRWHVLLQLAEHILVHGDEQGRANLAQDIRRFFTDELPSAEYRPQTDAQREALYVCAAGTDGPECVIVRGLEQVKQWLARTHGYDSPQDAAELDNVAWSMIEDVTNPDCWDTPGLSFGTHYEDGWVAVYRVTDSSALSQSGQAVPDQHERSRAEDAVRRLHSAASRFGHHIHNQQADLDKDKERILALTRALAANPADGDSPSLGKDTSPAVPDSIRRIMDEMAAARAKFPQWPSDPIHAVTVVQEEAGELSQAILQSVYEPSKADYSHALTEAVQLGAMAVRFIENMPLYRTPSTEQHEDAEAPYWQEVSMAETRPEPRRATLKVAAAHEGDEGMLLRAGFIAKLARDADRLERVERQVRDLAEHKEQCADAALAMPDSHNQHKAKAEDYSRQAAALRAIVDTGDEEG